MRVLLVNDYGSPTGGAEIQLLRLRHGLRERGHEARLFASRARPYDAPSEADDECFGTVSVWRTPLQAVNPWAYWSLRRVLREFRPDVVHVGIFLTQLSPLILPLLRTIPAVYHVQWYRPMCPLGTKRLPDGSDCRVDWGRACLRNGCLSTRAWLPLMLQRRLWRRWRSAFDHYVACGEPVHARLLEEGLGPVDVVPNSVSPSEGEPASFSDAPTVVFAGRFVPEKGVDVLVEAFAKVIEVVPGARLQLYGEGPERSRIEALVERLGLGSRTEMPGWLPRGELERRLATAWVQAVPSRWEEPFGLVAAEALMRGTPVVASDRGGLRDIVDEPRTGLLVSPDDAPALAAALASILGDRSAAERMGREGRQIASERFAEERLVDRMLHIYESLIAARATTAA